MTVVAIKQFSYSTWCIIAARNNKLRAERRLPEWSNNDSWHLWQALFAVKS